MNPSHQSFDEVAMTGHSDACVGLERYCQHSTSAFAICGRSAFHQHHRVKAAYLRLFEDLRKGPSLPHRDLKMLFSGFPLTCRRRGETRDRMRQAEYWEKRHRSTADQLTSERIELSCLRSLAEDDEALNHGRQHRPRTSGVRLAAKRQPPAFFIEDCKCAGAVAAISHLPKKYCGTVSLDRAPRFGAASGFGMRYSSSPVSAKEI